ncbi:hypothetical protein J2D73_11695 [Acetobacter sacchari]|uniref:Uncharacterized protein n=1 Tax=Acetobacter sacchari TaxID=2661687 RepID=A0ABS3LX65_9PROT|nr:hypothetical protein [Acetobacter sacchari]MBO1360451.1 hypothetical protein [Acetobacter sacchari]
MTSSIHRSNSSASLESFHSARTSAPAGNEGEGFELPRPLLTGSHEHRTESGLATPVHPLTTLADGAGEVAEEGGAALEMNPKDNNNLLGIFKKHNGESLMDFGDRFDKSLKPLTVSTALLSQLTALANFGMSADSFSEKQNSSSSESGAPDANPASGAENQSS